MDSELNKALLFIAVALVSYTIGLVLSRRYCYFNSITFLLLGLIFDVLGTWKMNDQSSSPWDWNLHSVLGTLALVAMAILAVLGFLAYRFYENNLFKIFRQALPYAYGVWLISLITGAWSNF